MAKVPQGVETLPKISIAWVACTNVTDYRQTDNRLTTDGQTDGRWHIASRSRSLKMKASGLKKLPVSEEIRLDLADRTCCNICSYWFLCIVNSPHCYVIWRCKNVWPWLLSHHGSNTLARKTCTAVDRWHFARRGDVMLAQHVIKWTRYVPRPCSLSGEEKSRSRESRKLLLQVISGLLPISNHITRRFLFLRYSLTWLTTVTESRRMVVIVLPSSQL